MKKLLYFVILLFFAAIYFISLSTGLMKKIVTYRSEKASWLADNHLYGDMYNLSYLSQYKVPESNMKQTVAKTNCNTNIKNIKLYAIIDSYIWEHIKELSSLCRVKSVKYSRLGHEDENALIFKDEKLINILLIEVSERNVRKHINSLIINKLSPDRKSVV